MLYFTIPALNKLNNDAENSIHEEAASEHSREEQEEQEEQEAQKVILYIEENRASVRLVETLLKQRPQCRLVATREPAQCAELVERYQPSLILLDINLPGIDGYQLLEQWREEPALQQTPIIVVTTDTMPDDVARAKTAGAAELLAKPIEINRFLTIIDSFIATQRIDLPKKIRTS